MSSTSSTESPRLILMPMEVFGFPFIIFLTSMAGVACNYASMQYYPEDIIAYAIMYAGRFCICNRVHPDVPKIVANLLPLCARCNQSLDKNCVVSFAKQK